ncbi:MAG: carbon-nitrogen hydrolase family protein [Promethearchaeota archaeon]
MKNIKISLIQCHIIQDSQLMNDNITEMIKKATQMEPDIIVLPERWRPIPAKKNIFNVFQEERGNDYNLIKSLSKRNKVSIISGGIWEKRNEDKPFITSYYFDKKGNEIGRQDKLHLYSYETSVFQPGKTLNIFTHKETQTKFSILICFDIAFFETPRLSVENGAELLISPTLIRQEGSVNWKIYLQARALENRIPIVACNPVTEFNERHFLGQSKIISFKSGYESPSVLKIREMNEKQGILSEKINIAFPNSIRKKRLNEKIEKNQINIKKII